VAPDDVVNETDFKGYKRDNMEKESNSGFSARQLVGDFCTSIGCVISTLSVLYCSNHNVVEVADATLGMAGVGVLGVALFPPVKGLGLILLQTVPDHMDVSRLKKALLREFPAIIQIHDLHVWCLTSTRIICTCHVTLGPHSDEEYQRLAVRMRSFFTGEGITLATVQPEFQAGTGNGTGTGTGTESPPGSVVTLKRCLYRCTSNGSKSNCIQKKCCQKEEEEEEEDEGVMIKHKLLNH
jgi:hypothetical protein